MIPADIEHTLRKIPLFSGLAAEQYRDLAGVVAMLPVEKGRLLFSEGDEARGFYIVVKGQVKIFKLSPDGKEQILHLFGPYEPFAEVALFAGASYPANAIILRTGTLLFIERGRFMDLIGRTPALALNLLGSMAMRLKKFSSMIEALSLKEVPGRLAEHVLHLSGRPGGGRTVRLEIPKTQLASLLGTIPETLSRILQKMSVEGLISVSGATITILDREGLEEVASGEAKLSERR